MGKMCDYRTQAISLAVTPRQVSLVRELLTRNRVFTTRGVDGYLRIGLAGLHEEYFRPLLDRLENLGFRFRVSRGDHDRVVYQMSFPEDP